MMSGELDFFFHSSTLPLTSTYLSPQHEAAKNDLSDKQKDLDTFTNKGKHLLAELKKVHNCECTVVKMDMDSTVDKWLDVRIWCFCIEYSL